MDATGQNGGRTVKLRRVVLSIAVLAGACLAGGLAGVVLLPGVASANPALWTVASSPNQGTDGSSLNGVSCVSTTFCTAVGYL